MSNKAKIQKDFLKTVGIENPQPEVIEKINVLPEGQLLKVIVKENSETPVRILAARYDVHEDRIESIKRNQK